MTSSASLVTPCEGSGAGPGAAERLLADHRAGRLVVDVEVARRVPQRLGGLGDGGAVRGQDRPGQRVRRDVSGLAQRLLVRGVRVDVHGQDRAEVLGGKDLVGRVRAVQDSGTDEKALAVVGGAAGQDLDRRRVPGPLQCGAVLGERPCIDDRAHEQRQVRRHVAHGQRLNLGEEVVLGPVPERLRQVRAGGGRALLALVLERAADERGGYRGRVRARVHEHEVLAAGLAHHARVVPVPGDVLAHGPPQVLEGRGRPGEVDAGQVGVGQRDPGHRLPVPGDQVDHSGRQPGRFEQAHRVVRGQLLGRRRLPHHHVAEQGRSGRQVAGDRGEVERGDGQHESLERAVLHPVPAAGRRFRLLAEDLPGVVDVVPPEVDHLAGRVDLRLVRRLGLAEDGGGVHGGAPGSG